MGVAAGRIGKHFLKTGFKKVDRLDKPRIVLSHVVIRSLATPLSTALATAFAAAPATALAAGLATPPVELGLRSGLFSLGRWMMDSETQKKRTSKNDKFD